MKNGVRIDSLDKLGKPYYLCINSDTIDYETIRQFEDCMRQPSVVQGFMAPDYHLGYVAPIGSVLATKDTIFAAFIGYDIGCGVSECLLDIDADNITRDQFTAIKNQILRDIPIGFNRHKSKQQIPKSNPNSQDCTEFAGRILHETGAYQLGTLGGGNHFIELGRSEETGKLSIIIHSGSRGVGHKIATHYMKEAAIANTDEQRYIDEFDNKETNLKWVASMSKKKTSAEYANAIAKYIEARKEFVYRRVRARVNNIEDAYPLDVNTQLGKDYINDMNMCLEFALANRKAMIDKCIYAVQRVLNKGMNGKCEETIKQLRFINRNHNHAELIEESVFYKE